MITTNHIALAVLLALIVAVAVFYRRISARWAREQAVVDLRIADMASAQRASGSAFGQGAAAALTGAEFWENPHCTPTGMRDAGLAWNAGWCYGRRKLRDVWKETPP